MVWLAVVGLLSITAFLWVIGMTNIWQQRQAAWQNRNATLGKVDTLAAIKPRDAKETLWAKACEEYLVDNPYCSECDKRGYTMPADCVGHIRHPKDNPVLFWDMNNWRALCTSCRNRLVGTAIIKIPNPIPDDTKLYMVKA